MTRHRRTELLLLAFLLAAFSAAAQEPSATDAADPSAVIEPARLLLPAHDGRTWLEIVPRDGAIAPRTLVSDGVEDDGLRRVDTGLAEVAALICRGGVGRGSACEELFLASGSSTILGLPRGSVVTGRLYLDGDAVVGAAIRVVPADLELETPFTVPLTRRDGEVVREVASGADGDFRLPPLAADRYFLEVMVPGGRRIDTRFATGGVPIPTGIPPPWPPGRVGGAKSVYSHVNSCNRSWRHSLGIDTERDQENP